MGRKYRVISADGHVETPPDTFVKYVPERWRDRAPRLVPLSEGGEGWVIEGMPLLHNGQNITAGKPIKFRNDTYFAEDGSPATGAGPAEQRLREQDRDGIDCEVLFPPVFASRFLTGVADRDAYLSMVQAYNTFLAQDYCAVAPDRLIGNGVVPVKGIDQAVLELKRCGEIGIKSVSLQQFPNGSGAPEPEDDEFWETALDIGMRISPHGNFGHPAPPEYGGGAGTGSLAYAVSLTQRTGGFRPLYCIAQLIASGVFDRFPDIRFYFAETNASWLSSLVWFMDDNYRIFKHWYGPLAMKPSEYIFKHCRFSFIRDPLALKLRDFVPVDILMWGSDFPHSVGSFPNSQEWIDQIFEGESEAVKRRILLENPCEFFGLDPKADITPTPGVEVAA